MKLPRTRKLQERRYAQGAMTLYATFVLMTLILCFAVLVDVQNFFYFRAKITDQITTGAQYGALLINPWTETNQLTIKRIVQTGSLTPSSQLLTSAWQNPNSSLVIESINLIDFNQLSKPALQITAQVIYHPIIIPFDLPIRVSHAEILQTT